VKYVNLYHFVPVAIHVLQCNHVLIYVSSRMHICNVGYINDAVF